MFVRERLSCLAKEERESFSKAPTSEVLFVTLFSVPLVERKNDSARFFFFIKEPLVLLLYFISILRSKVTHAGSIHEYTQLVMLTHHSHLKGLTVICHSWSQAEPNNYDGEYDWEPGIHDKLVKPDVTDVIWVWISIKGGNTQRV